MPPANHGEHNMQLAYPSPSAVKCSHASPFSVQLGRSSKGRTLCLDQRRPSADRIQVEGRPIDPSCVVNRGTRFGRRCGRVAGAAALLVCDRRCDRCRDHLCGNADLSNHEGWNIWPLNAPPIPDSPSARCWLSMLVAAACRGDIRPQSASSQRYDECP